MSRRTDEHWTPGERFWLSVLAAPFALIRAIQARCEARTAATDLYTQVDEED